jgi:hypothetical protein
MKVAVPQSAYQNVQLRVFKILEGDVTEPASRFCEIFIALLVGIVSCTSPKKTLVKMPKWEKEHVGSKRQIKKYTKNFVKNLYDTTKLKDTTKVENIIQK